MTDDRTLFRPLQSYLLVRARVDPRIAYMYAVRASQYYLLVRARVDPRIAYCTRHAHNSIFLVRAKIL